MASGLLGAPTNVIASLARNPLSFVATNSALISLLYKKPQPVKLGADAAQEREANAAGPNNLRLGIITFDAVLSEGHQMTAAITSHPVEDGSNITDHIRKEPEELQIDGIVSGHPIKFLSQFRVQSDPVDAAYTTLRDIMNKSTLVDVVTTLHTYRSMAIKSVSVTRDAESGNILNVSIGLKEVRKVFPKKEALPEPADKVNAKKTDGGTVPIKDAPAFEASKAKSFGETIYGPARGIESLIRRGLSLPSIP